MLELTTTFRSISTATRPAADAAGAAAAHLRYIDRDSAVECRAIAGIPGQSLDEQRTALRARFREVAGQGGEVGRRVAEKLIVSLPNSWDAAARQAALTRIVEHLAPAGSDAAAWGVVHGDKPGNRHLHVIAQDGAESREAALARRPGAKRVRRRNVIRLGDKSRAGELRGELAGILNEIADERGLEGVEWRSFEARGIAQEPGRHDGPRRRAIAEKRVQAARTALNDELDAFFTAGGVDDLDGLDGLPAAPQEAQRPPEGHPVAKTPSPHPQQGPRPPQAPPVAAEALPEPQAAPSPAPGDQAGGQVPDRNARVRAAAEALAARKKAAADRARQGRPKRRPTDPETR